MSLPPELRVLCAHLNTTSTSDLPRLTPTLLRYVTQCHAPLSSQSANTTKPDSSAASVHVHKLKTHLSSLLNGKSPEGRFAAAVLIKGVVEAGGWEILKGSEPWVRGLLSILGKPDSSATKEMCIVTLTKIYRMTHQFQTLLREITTPTLPGFITSCLNLLNSKTSYLSMSTVETIFQSFIMLIPRHTTIYRPFASQIRLVTKPYLAPTSTDNVLITYHLQRTAQHLAIMLHQTIAKGGGGEDWGKSFRELLKSAHVTADMVFRAVIEDWESTAGYVGENVDTNDVPSGGGRSADDLSPWNGIGAGAERLTGIFRYLSTYFRVDTSTPVTIPLGAVTDLLIRVMSISIPATGASKTREGPRLNPAIDKDEKDMLWSHMPQIYVAALELVEAMSDRLQEAFLPLAQGVLIQTAWIFTYGMHSADFRVSSYQVIAKLLALSGQNLNKLQASKLVGVIRSCCKDLHEPQGLVEGGPTSDRNGATGPGQIADSFLPPAAGTLESVVVADSALTQAASHLLPLFASCIPQQYLDIAVRSLIERTAILSHNKEAMLECVLHPFLGKNGAPLASIVPHLTRACGSDSLVEILLRPRMPLVPASNVRYVNDSYEEEDADEDMDFHPEVQQVLDNNVAEKYAQGQVDGISSVLHVEATRSSGTPANPPHIPTPTRQEISTSANDTANHIAPKVPSSAFMSAPTSRIQATAGVQDTEMVEASEDSSDAESVHLTMQLDSESGSDEE